MIALVLSSSVGCEGIPGPWFSESGDATPRVFVADSETNGSGVPVTSAAEQAGQGEDPRHETASTSRIPSFTR